MNLLRPSAVAGLAALGLIVLAAAIHWAGALGPPGHAHRGPGTAPGAARGGRSLAEPVFVWPTFPQLARVLTLRDYNTRVVYAGTTLLGAVGGLVGTFLLLRKRSLLSDTVSHATLPGIALAFLLAEALGVPGKSLPVLLSGAAVMGLVGMSAVVAIRNRSRIKDDAALAIVLSVFFGLGIALLVFIQQLPTGNTAGLNNFIYGKAASMTAQDAQLILAVALGIGLACMALYKEFTVLCFDPGYAAAQGWPVLRLDFALMGLVVAVTVIGLQAVGLLLVVALLIIPPAAARFWSESLTPTLLLATVMGAASSYVGVTASALLPRLPAGAVIVLSAALCFGFSLVFGRRRGVVVRTLSYRRVSRRVARQHLLRTTYECLERKRPAASSLAPPALDQPVAVTELQAADHRSRRQLLRLVRGAERDGLVVHERERDHYCLTARGKLEARNVTRNHRLWELYLLNYADVAPHRIHHDADTIEHVVEPEIVNQLEEMLAARLGVVAVPADPERLRNGDREPYAI